MMSKLDPRFTKEAKERRVFEALSPLIGWVIVPGSTRQPVPPHPDIRCEVVGHGPLAVELVALDTPGTHLRLSNMFRTPDAWAQAMAQRCESEQQILKDDLGNAHISVHFANDAGTRDRSAVLYGLQSLLLARRGFAGRVTAEDLEYPHGFHSANIGRFASITNGPQVASPSGDYLRPPQVDKIVEKLRDKRYEPAGTPMELFAYATHDEPDGAVGWLESIQAAVNDHIAESRFRRVHLFHLGFQRHIWSSP